MSDSFILPSPWSMARQGFPRLVEATLVPLALFYGFLQLAGVAGGLAAALIWSYAALGRRLLTGRPVTGVLLLGVAGITVRTAIAFVTNSVFVYFLQPTLVTVAMGVAFLVSLAMGRPLAQRLADDFVVLPDEISTDPKVRRFFHQISMLWGVVLLGTAAGSLWLLSTQPIGTFLVAKTALSIGVTGLAVTYSWAVFQRLLRRHAVVF